MEGVVWDFDWSDCVRASEYHLFVTGADAPLPVEDRSGIVQSSFRHLGCGGYILDEHRLNWRWRVRAKTEGVWGDWSGERTFGVEPVNTDPPLGCG